MRLKTKIMDIEKNIIVTGSSGFIGKNLISYLNANQNFNIINLKLDKNIDIFLPKNSDIVIHLTGKAHDLKNITDSSEYYNVNTELTKRIFDAFLLSNAKVFVILSSVKAIADSVKEVLTEVETPNPLTHYGKSKLLAEQYILSKSIPKDKKVYILRPCMIHGPGNKGNLNLLFNLVSKGFPWPLGQFDNSRSYLSIENLCFVINELIVREEIQSGIYNVADDIPLSTNDVIKLIVDTSKKKIKILNINKSIINKIAMIGDFFKLPINTDRLQKLTESYVVSNDKIKSVLGKPMPISSKEGLIRTFQSFSSDV